MKRRALVAAAVAALVLTSCSSGDDSDPTTDASGSDVTSATATSADGSDPALPTGGGDADPTAQTDPDSSEPTAVRMGIGTLSIPGKPGSEASQLVVLDGYCFHDQSGAAGTLASAELLGLAAGVNYAVSFSVPTDGEASASVTLGDETLEATWAGEPALSALNSDEASYTVEARTMQLILGPSDARIAVDSECLAL